MDEVKQKLTFVFSSNKQTNQFQNELSQQITSIENLSNELFYEIFDYLDGCDIYQSFSDLNHHFQQLINSSFLLYKIKHWCFKVEDQFTKNWKQILSHHRSQIFSINLYMSSHINEFILSSSFIIDSSLNNLESLVVWGLESDVLTSFLINLTALPRLFSLTVKTCHVSMDLTNIYRLVFNLRMLKYYKFSISDTDLSVSLPIATNEQYSSIEYLVTDHCCTFKELSAIISYTPQLRHLKFTHDLDGTLNNRIIPKITLANLTYLSIHMFNVNFDEFEIFIKKIYSKLKSLCVISQSQDITFLDAYRWEKLILQYLPELEKFSFKYDEYIDDDIVYTIYPGQSNQFTSSFWIERQWLLETEIDYEHIYYLIRSYKKRWYEYPHDQIVVNSSTELSKSNRLNIMDVPAVDSYQSLITHIKRILTIASIYHLEITDNISFGMLFRVLDLLPELNSLKIYSVTFDELKTLSPEERDIMYSILMTSKIKKVYLQGINIIEEVSCFLIFFPSTIYLKVNNINDIDIELGLRNILLDIDECNENIRSLCFRIPTADDQMIKILEKMLTDEKLLADFTIKRVSDNIYLQWK